MEGRDEEPARNPISPEQKASLPSLLTWSWLNPLISLGNRKTLQVRDLYELLPKDTALHYEEEWRESIIKEVDEKKRSKKKGMTVCELLFRCLGKDYCTIALWEPLWLAAMILQVYILKALVKVVAEEKHKFRWWWGMLLVMGMFFGSTAQSVSQNNLFNASQRLSMRARAIVSMAVFDKMLSLKLAALKGCTDGTKLNLITNDTQKLIDGGTYFHVVWFSLVEIIVICTLAIIEAGLSAVPGVILVFLLQPLPVWMGWAVGRLRREAIKFTDARITLLAEILSGIKTVKYNGWTAPFLRFIARIRNNELKCIKKAAYIRSSTSALKNAVTPLASLVVFGTYAGIHGRLSATMSFTVLALLSVLVRVFNFAPVGAQYGAEACIAVQRIQRFLNIPNGSRKEDETKKASTSSEVSVFVKEGWFSWVINLEKNAPSLSTGQNICRQGSEKARIQAEKEVEFAQGVSLTQKASAVAVLKDINIIIEKGKLIGIMGHVGSGKSSFLLSLLGETECLRGVCRTEKPVAYVPQQPWVLNDSVRNNILFGLKYDATRYYETIKACALDTDVARFPAGHDTEIGERGLNLSGGQKARISLARACYSCVPLVLIDDPFAGVDAPTARHLIQHVLHGVLKGRTIILVSHNRQALACCDENYIMDGGSLQAISKFGSSFEDPNQMMIMEEEKEVVEPLDTNDDINHFHNEPESSDDRKIPHENQGKDKASLAYSLNAPSEAESEAPVVSDPVENVKPEGKCFAKPHSTTTDKEKGALTVKEDRVEGHVTWSTYINYLKAGGG